MKKVVASLGIISAGAFALFSTNTALAAQNNGQDIAALKARVAKMEATLNNITNNSKGNATMGSNWFQKLTLGGGADIDANFGSVGATNDSGSTGNISRFTGYNGKRMSLTDAYLVLDAQVNNWVSARVSTTYYDATANYNYSGVDTNAADNNFRLDQAYVTFANFAQKPYMVRVGQQYMAYGHYNLHPISQTMTQVLTEIDNVGLTAGYFGLNGFSATAFAFENPMAKTNSVGNVKNNRPYNWGVSFNYNQPAGKIGYYVGAGYLYNITGLDAFQRDGIFPNSAYSERQGAFELHAGMNTGPYSVNASYASAKGNIQGLDYKTGKLSQPSAFNLNAAYNFMLATYNSTVNAGYEHSYQASRIGMPLYRAYVGYSMSLFKNTDLGLQYSRVHDYGTNYKRTATLNSTGEAYNLVTARLSVGF